MMRTTGMFLGALLTVASAGCGHDSQALGANAEPALRENLRVVTMNPFAEADLRTLVGDADIVLLGEDTHGTREFYELRASITRALITELGFTAVAVEGDFPELSPVNDYVRHRLAPADPLSGVTNYPAWMWRNEEFRELVEFLRARNAEGSTVGVYGLDLQNLPAALERTVEALEPISAPAAARAQGYRNCFMPAGGEGERYGEMAARGALDCEDEARALLQEVDALQASARAAGKEDAWFDARENARAVRNGEDYYRTAFGGRASAWNVRDRHMADVALSILRHQTGAHERPRLVVWAHNTHVGDARATQMGDAGELSLGQLLRMEHSTSTFLLGLSTWRGTVTASSTWGGAPMPMELPAAREESYEGVFHSLGVPRFLLPLQNEQVREALAGERPERAVGVVYSPATERAGNYLDARITEQFDAVLFVDESTALEPLPTPGS